MNLSRTFAMCGALGVLLDFCMCSPQPAPVGPPSPGEATTPGTAPLATAGAPTSSAQATSNSAPVASTAPVATSAPVASSAPVATSAPVASSTPVASAEAQTAGPAPAGNELLSVDWARRQARTDSTATAAADALRTQGYAAYRKKDDATAVARYEAALRLHASGRLYFDYANSLSNIPRFADAVTAYQVAIELGFEHPEVALYGVACAESRAKNAEAAYGALDLAVERGFLAFAKMQSDPDLAFLRARADWAEHFARLSASPTLLVGNVGVTDYRMDYHYTVCPDATVRETSLAGLDDSSCCKSIRYGKLQREGDKLVIHWSKRCGQTGVGKPDMSHGNPVCAPTKSCSQRSCRSLDEKTELLAVKDLPGSVNKPRPRDDDHFDAGIFYHVPFAHGAPPECAQTN